MVTIAGFCLVFLASAGVGSAIPSPYKIGTTVVDNSASSGLGEGKLSVKQVRNPHYRFNGAWSIYKTHLKYGAPIPDYLAEAVAKSERAAALASRSQGTGKAIPIDKTDTAYVTPVTIGTPPQTLKLDFDTGSSDLWVFSSHLPTSQIRGQAIYTPGKSSTSSLLNGHSWSIRYGDGSASNGNVYIDNVTVGALTIPGQAIECAKSVSSQFTHETSMDGLVGLAFSTLNTVTPKAQKTLFDNIKAKLDNPLFSVDLKYHAEGTYDFGFIDPTKHTGNITYVPIRTDPGYWLWTSSGYSIGSGAFNSIDINGIADTGTTLLYLPTSIVTAYYRNVQGAVNGRSTYGGYVFPCSATPPSFTFGVGSARITIPGAYMNAGPVDSASSSTCYGGLQSSESVGMNIWGDVALKAALVVFDGQEKPRLGWAPKELKY